MKTNINIVGRGNINIFVDQNEVEIQAGEHKFVVNQGNAKFTIIAMFDDDCIQTGSLIEIEQE